MRKVLLIVIFMFCFICGCNGSVEHVHTYEEKWQYDDEVHYHQANCEHDLKNDEAIHQFEEKILVEPTHFIEGEKQYTCIVCNYTKTETVNVIEHSYSSEYSFDDLTHYYLCECGDKKDLEEHEYGEGEVVVEETQLTDGLKIYTCKCGSVKEEVIKAKGFIIDNKKETIYLITTSAGSDISKAVGISWHCKDSGSYLIYQKEGNEEYIKVLPDEEYWSIEESFITDKYQNKRYVCTVDLSNLDPNTKYVYKVVCGDIASNDLSFKTASGTNSKYSFLSFVDFQYSENQTTLNLVKKFIEKTEDANLITWSGDFADEGYMESSHRHLFDSGVFSNSILAFGVGDHEYWGSDKSPIKMFKEPYSYNKLFNNPNNGCEGYKNSSYYFKYNTTLFVFLDCGDSNVSSSNEMFSKQAKWLDTVLTIQEYEFVVVCMHKSLYGDPKQDSTVRKFASVFTSIFDKHKVDLVISGHDHEYSRTKPISNGMSSSDGTIYLDLGNSGNKTRATGDEIKTSDLYDKYIDIKANNYSLGIIGTVEDGKLKITVRNLDFITVDSVEITKKNR